MQQVREDSLFKGISKQFQVGRYHSWKISEELPKELNVTVLSDTNEIMAIRHISHDTTGVQFHPESILTPEGRKIINNWILEK